MLRARRRARSLSLYGLVIRSAKCRGRPPPLWRSSVTRVTGCLRLTPDRLLDLKLLPVRYPGHWLDSGDLRSQQQLPPRSMVMTIHVAMSLWLRRWRYRAVDRLIEPCAYSRSTPSK